MVQFDGVDASAGDKSVEKSSKSWKNVKKSEKPQRSEEFIKVISLEERLPKNQSSVN